LDKATEIALKTERLTAMMAAENLEGVLLQTQHNFAWLTAGGSNMLDISSESGAGALLVRRDGKRFVLANRIEMPRLLTEEISAAEFEPVEFSWEEEKSAPTFVAKRALDLLDNSSLGCDLSMKSTGRSIEFAIARCRYQLTTSEVERFRALGHDAGEVVGSLARTLEPGESEKEIARRVSASLAARDMTGIVTLVAADQRLREFRHPVPTDNRWRQVAMIVVCARRRGLIASLTRIVSAGAIPDQLQRQTAAAARVNARIWTATRPGARGSELYRVAARAYAEEGFPGEERLHHQGGACGYRTRDWVAHPACEEEIRIHQAFAWNPSITGTKVEETCILFEGDLENVTASPDWPSISVSDDGRSYEMPGVLSL
jgi:Xaa-Pro aminopeptidase